MPVTPFINKDRQPLIERAFPTGKVSLETQKERKAGAGQTLTGLGSYWKGRKPLILTRALVLASLIPASDNLERDVEILELLLGMDERGMARRLPKGQQGLLGTASYGELVLAAKRPEEIGDPVLLDGIWDEVNAHLGTSAASIQELVEQLGVMRFGRRPKLADTFSGSGSIPFEAARMGCDVYASDLNPVACMLTWGAFNIVGASPEEHARMKAEQERIVAAIDAEICAMGVEHDAAGNRAKVFLYCLETRCPRTGWMVPMAPSWVISKKRNVIARLVPDHAARRYEIEILTGVSAAEMTEAEQGTVRKGRLFHPMLEDEVGIAIKEIRGDYKDEEGVTRNRLRPWEITDIRPREDDIWQERLYAIQWMDAGDLAAGKANPKTWFAAPTAEDLAREEEVAAYVERHLAEWQAAGFVPDMEIEPGVETTRLFRERGWTHWHHLFNPRHLLVNAVAARHAKPVAHMNLGLAGILDASSRLSVWHTGNQQACNTFLNQSLNPNLNYPSRGFLYCRALLEIPRKMGSHKVCKVLSMDSKFIESEQDLIITDPPYADAVQYDEITEFFIAWLRKNPPAPFNEWVWDSRRALAIKGEGQGFKAGMVEAYKAMTDHLADNGLQIVQFTHQDVKTFSDMAQIFWGAGLQVVQDWYVSTETMNGLKVGGYVQGTHMIVLRKRGEPLSGYSDEIQEEIRLAVAEQVADMVGLNQKSAGRRRDGNLFNDADLQMAGYAAALRVLTGYTRIDGTDMTREALRPRKKGERTLVDEMMEFAVRVANEHLIPDGIDRAVWLDLSGAERFFLRMTDMEAAGQPRLDDYQNFAKAFRVDDYTALMGSLTPNAARLRTPAEMGKKHLAEEVEFGGRSLVRIGLHAIWKLERGEETDLVLEQLRDAIPDYYRKRGTLLAIIAWLAERWRAQDGGHPVAARVLAEALRVEKI